MLFGVRYWLVAWKSDVMTSGVHAWAKVVEVREKDEGSPRGLPVRSRVVLDVLADQEFTSTIEGATASRYRVGDVVDVWFETDFREHLRTKWDSRNNSDENATYVAMALLAAVGCWFLGRLAKVQIASGRLAQGARRSMSQ
jgi:hypothetical protein